MKLKAKRSDFLWLFPEFLAAKAQEVMGVRVLVEYFCVQDECVYVLTDKPVKQKRIDAIRRRLKRKHNPELTRLVEALLLKINKYG